MGPANDKSHYNVTSSLIGWAHTQNDSCDTVPMAHDTDKHLMPYTMKPTMNWLA